MADKKLDKSEILAQAAFTEVVGDKVVVLDISDNNEAKAITITELQTVMGLIPTTFMMTGVPTSDPSVAGQVWSNSGVLTVSAG